MTDDGWQMTDNGALHSCAGLFDTIDRDPISDIRHLTSVISSPRLLLLRRTTSGSPMKNILPAVWKVPEQIRVRLGESVGRQRPMFAEGHLLLVLHEPPGPDDDARVGRFFWRDADGSWKSNSLGTGIQALRTHLAEFATRIDALESLVEHATSADSYYRVLQAVVPLQRTARNLHAVLQQA